VFDELTNKYDAGPVFGLMYPSSTSSWSYLQYSAEYLLS